MDIRSLGYSGFGTSRLEDWPGFATGLVGMQLVERTSTSLAFRMDDRRQRLFLDGSLGESERIFGWEVDDAAALDGMAARLEAAGVRVDRAPRGLADRRFVADLVSFRDPAGNRMELFHGPEVSTDPFLPGRNISGFRTGPLGLGHAVLTVESIAEMLPFYTDVMGFHLSDYALRPFKAYFLHVNARHHSLAMVETGRNGVHHLMVELFSLDDVGQAYDIAQAEEGRVGVTLGRHTNDFMTSFYATSPGNFMVECGWGGRDIDPANWTPVESPYGPSLWGHDRAWLTPERRAEARALRMQAAADGLREPVQVMAGNHSRLEGVCPWWDAVVASE